MAYGDDDTTTQEPPVRVAQADTDTATAPDKDVTLSPDPPPLPDPGRATAPATPAPDPLFSATPLSKLRPDDALLKPLAPESPREETERLGLEAMRLKVQEARRQLEEATRRAEEERARSGRISDAMEKELAIRRRLSEELIRQMQQDAAERKANRPQILPLENPPTPRFTPPPGWSSGPGGIPIPPGGAGMPGGMPGAGGPGGSMTGRPNLFGPGSPGARWVGPATTIGGIGPAGLLPQNKEMIDSYAAMLKGWNDGQMERFNIDYKIWADKNNVVIKTNEQARQQYQDILSDQKLSFDQKMKEIELAAAPYHDVQVMELARRGDAKSLDDINNGRMNAINNMADAAKEMHDLLTKSERAAGGGGRGLLPDEAANDIAEAVVLRGDYGRFANLTPTQKGQVEGKATQVARLHNIPQHDVDIAFANVRNLARFDQAEMQRLGPVAAQVLLASTELANSIPIALRAARAVASKHGDFRWTFLNDARNASLAIRSDPDFQALNSYNQTVLRNWVSATNPRATGTASLTLAAQKNHVFSLSTSYEAYEEQMKAAWNEAVNSQEGVALAKQGLLPRNPWTGQPGGFAPGIGTGGATGGGSPGPAPATTPSSPPSRVPNQDAINVMIQHKNDPEYRRVFTKRYGSDALQRYNIPDPDPPGGP